MLRLSKRALRRAALVTLLLPTAVFLLTWVRARIAVPSLLLLVLALFFYLRDPRETRLDDDVWTCSYAMLGTIIACAFLWTFLSGIGGYFYQNEDHYGRNAIFHDLLNHTWPVYFEGTPFALTYYIAYWLLPALFGKGIAALLSTQLLWGAANAALFVQTLWFLLLIFLLLFSYLDIRRLREAVLTLLVFVLFSGMDILPAAYLGAANLQVEWWAELYQYSSHTTCLFWVYNQAVPAWLCLMLLLHTRRGISSYVLIGLAALPFSPLPFVGIVFLMVGLFFARLYALSKACGMKHAVCALLREGFSPQNVLAALAIAPSMLTYFAANQATGEAPLRLELFLYAFSPDKAFARLLLFYLVEFGALALLLGKRFGRKPLFVLAALSLLLAPLFRMGHNADFSMRASIPGVTLLCVYALRYLLESLRTRAHRYGAAVLVVLLLLGAGTALEEFRRGVYKVRNAQTVFGYADPFGTVLHEDADTFNFICKDTQTSLFYRIFAQKETIQ